MKVLLGIIDNKRPEYLDRTIRSIEENIDFDFVQKIIIDDSGDKLYSNYLLDIYGNRFSICSHASNKGLSGSVRSLWNIAKETNADYIFHVEGDFLFNTKIDISLLLNIFNFESHLAQIALKRQPVNYEEFNAGGFMELNLSSYSDKFIESIDFNWVEHRNYFTLNPSLYPKWVVDLGWEIGWGEKEFSERLFSNHLTRCGFFGKKEDSPLVTHIGDSRGVNWFV